MNFPTLLVLLLVAAVFFLALRACLRGRGTCSCASSGCTGKKSSSCTGCPYCQGK